MRIRLFFLWVLIWVTLDILSIFFKEVTVGFILGSWLGYHIGKYREEYVAIDWNTMQSAPTATTVVVSWSS